MHCISVVYLMVQIGFQYISWYLVFLFSLLFNMTSVKNVMPVVDYNLVQL